MRLKDYEIGKYYKRVNGEETFIFRVLRINFCLHIEPMEHIPDWVDLHYVPHQSAEFSSTTSMPVGMRWDTDFAILPSEFDVEAREDEITLASLDKPDMDNEADRWYNNVFHKAQSFGGRP